ncbi:hypothetical protein FOMPIDRAFT_1133127 [Fomitopsis schrenkii]|uniref:Metallo-beta-lactamase domain-containing protein n=1 Tax=Fomitopsis schrenkii TaxID=2126942 RepID=S8DNX2_FOMSC|nr:hypothetical protein FOMPIDRAFT_1133127 [Fomitopsis schrenkii]
MSRLSTDTLLGRSQVTKGVWTFSWQVVYSVVICAYSPKCAISPFSRFGLIPFGGRSTAIKLSNGDVWVMASTPLTAETKAKLNELGPVKWIVGADAVHHMFLGEFKKEYPEAKLVAVDEAVKKKSKEGLEFHGVWGTDPRDRQFGFENDVQHCFFDGFANRDTAFFHPASKTLIVADLLFNLPATEQYSKSSSSGTIPIFGSLTPYMGIHKRFTWYLGVDKEAMKRDVKTVANWDFDRIIPCHGDVIEKDGKKAWCEAYKWYIDADKKS